MKINAVRFLCLLAFIGISLTNAEGAPKPNVVLIIADDMGWKDTGYSGNPVVKTPVLDDMAAKGLRFDSFYASGNMCCPGRYAILSGRTPFRGGVIGNHPHLRPAEVLLPRGLKLAGYRTSYIGKWHIGYGKTGPAPMGFDEAIWTNGGFRLEGRLTVENGKPIEFKGDSSVALMNIALDFVQRQAKAPQPFFVTVAFTSPHRPHVAAPEFKALYKDLAEEDAHYYGQISGIDTAVGKLREELRRLGLTENTVVWFVSDNGGSRKNSRDPAGKGKGNIGARTVALLEWPGHIMQPGRQVAMPCDQVDIYPTVLEWAGVQFPGQPVLDGISLVPLLKGEMSGRRKPLGYLDQAVEPRNFGQGDFLTETWGIWIDGQYKLVIHSAARQPVLLFDMAKDASEKINVSDKMPDVVNRMRTAFNEWRQSVKKSYDGKDFAGAASRETSSSSGGRP